MLVLTTFLATACAGTLEPGPVPASGYGARADAPARRSEERNHARLPDSVAGGQTYACGDTVMGDQLSSGGQRIVQAVPCWDTGEERLAHDEYMAQLGEARSQAAESADQRADARLVAEEGDACRGLSPRELEHSPFAHRREISEVIPHRETGMVHGVRIIWKSVPGLTASWMRKAIACHRARFERLGEPAIYFPEDPTLVSHAVVSVEEHGGHLEVLVETSDEPNGQVALDRANNLIHPKTAVR